MKKIRRSIFETNSSSTHSIVLANKSEGIRDTCIRPGNFCRDYQEYYDFNTKASYIYTYALLEINSDKEDGIKDMLSKVVKDEFGVNVIFKLDYDDFFGGGKGYIDDRSWDVCEKVAFDEDKMKLFLFNANSVLIIDRD